MADLKQQLAASQAVAARAQVSAAGSGAMGGMPMKIPTVIGPYEMGLIGEFLSVTNTLVSVVPMQSVEVPSDHPLLSCIISMPHFFMLLQSAKRHIPQTVYCTKL